MSELEFKKPFRIQVLKPPGGVNITDQNLGFKPQALERTSKAFTFKHMGCSDGFECGKLPTAFRELQDIGQKNDFSIGTIEVDIPDQQGQTQTVYIFGPTAFMEDITAFIQAEAKGTSGLGGEQIFFRTALTSGEELTKAKGWFDLSNHYFFFIDEGMFERTLDLFKYPRPEPNTSPSTQPPQTPDEIPELTT